MIKRFSRTIIYLCLMMMILNFVPQLAMAQDDEETIGAGTDFGDPDAPIDGGIGLLIAAGVGYGIKKYRDERKRCSARP